MANKPKWKVGFNKDGVMYHYIDYWRGNPHTYVEPYQFYDGLKFVRFEKGSRSGAWAWLESTTEQKMYCISLPNLEACLNQAEPGCVITGLWTFKKRGANYTIVYLQKEKTEDCWECTDVI